MMISETNNKQKTIKKKEVKIMKNYRDTAEDIILSFISDRGISNLTKELVKLRDNTEEQDIYQSIDKWIELVTDEPFNRAEMARVKEYKKKEREEKRKLKIEAMKEYIAKHGGEINE